jgi:hypothetical protein
MRVVEVAEIRGVNGCARKDSWRKRRQSLSGALEQGRSRMAVTADKTGSKISGADNFIGSGSAFATREFGNNTSGGLPVDLDMSHDKIVDSKSKRRVQVVGTFVVDGRAFLGQQSKDLFGELGGRTGKT